MDRREAAEPVVRYAGRRRSNRERADGGLPPAKGVHNFQMMRAERQGGSPDDGPSTWAYNHGPMLAHWNGRFWLEYLSNPVHEHIPPGRTLLMSSVDGIEWTEPEVLFPVYEIPAGEYKAARWRTGVLGEGATIKRQSRRILEENSYSVMHQRMGFYVAPDDRLLALGFYGICPTGADQPNDGNGIGRVVREVKPDGTLGPIYFIRLNTHVGWKPEDVKFPLYDTSDDPGFVAACRALLEDRLATLQWYEEDRDPAFFPPGLEACKALSSYHLDDGRVIGLWKESKVSISEDEGHTWAPIVRSESLIMAGGKVWGQRTSDGRYALLFTPVQSARYPLAIMTSDDGLVYDDLLLVNGDVSRQRYPGLHKGPGQHYFRGISEGNGVAPDGAIWVTYSVSKEDIWISRISVPVTGAETDHIEEDFSGCEPGRFVPGWNVTSLQLAPVEIVETEQGNCLRIRDEDPYDYARADRLIPLSRTLSVETRVMVGQTGDSDLWVSLDDAPGDSVLALRLKGDASIEVNGTKVGSYETGRWMDLRLQLDDEAAVVSIDGSAQTIPLEVPSPFAGVCRVSYRTGEPWTRGDTIQGQRIEAESGHWEVHGEPRANAGKKAAPSEYFIGALQTSSRDPNQ